MDFALRRERLNIANNESQNQHGTPFTIIESSRCRDARMVARAMITARLPSS
jgi:hypothetical protein